MPLNKVKPITILMADDDEDDRLLTQDALIGKGIYSTYPFKLSLPLLV